MSIDVSKQNAQPWLTPTEDAAALAKQNAQPWLTPPEGAVSVSKQTLEPWLTPPEGAVSVSKQTMHAWLIPPNIPAGAMAWVGGATLLVSGATFAIASGAMTWAGATPRSNNPNVFTIPSDHMTWAGSSPVVNIPSPIGFRWQATVISQYVDSPTLVRLIENLNDYLNPSDNFDAFYNLVWNVNTAQGWGLDVWGRIVGVNRVLHVSTGALTFGWEEGGATDYTGFGQAPFYSGGSATANFSLSDDAYRTLILAKALANITDGSIPAINQILLNLFPNRGDCYCTDGLDMTMTYTFNFALSPVELAIVEQSGVLPKSTGVAASVVVI